MIPELKTVTEYYASRFDEVSVAGRATHEASRLNALAKSLFQQWAREIEAIGGSAEHPWVVLLDSGDGFSYVWRHGESDLAGYVSSGYTLARMQPISNLDS
jgi:hypothetical protein